MKKNKVEYKIDSFVDYTGTERKFIMAAVSIVENIDSFDSETELTKCLSIGISVCDYEDEFDEELGKNIAKGKAEKHRNHCLYASNPGLINTTMVKAVLEQEAAFFKSNPGYYLKGYDLDKKRYEMYKSIDEYEESLKHEDKNVYNYIINNIDKCIQMVTNICRKQKLQS